MSWVVRSMFGWILRPLGCLLSLACLGVYFLFTGLMFAVVFYVNLRHNAPENLAHAALGSFGVSAVYFGAVLLMPRSRRETSALGSGHGTACWGDPAALVQRQGLPVGREGKSILRHAGEGHLLTIAPTGGGKGIGAVVPALLEYPGSVLVTDLKGENHAVTARWRATQLGQRVITLDPFSLVGGLEAYNPMDALSPDSLDVQSDADLLARMLVVPSEKQDAEAFWDDEAAALISGLILYVVCHEDAERRHLGTVRECLTLGPSETEAMFEDMRQSTAAHGLVRRAANRISQKADRERSGVVSSAQRHTQFLDSPRMTRVLGKSSFSPEELNCGRLTIYLAIPPHHLAAYNRWLRLVVASILHRLMSASQRPTEKILFLLDEFAALGRFQPVEQAVSVARGYGIRLWLLLQDLAQLRTHYSERWPTFLANAALLQAFGTADEWTADYLSRLTGTTTVRTPTSHSGQSLGLGGPQFGTGSGLAETGRRLLTPDEIRRIPSDRSLLFRPGASPLFVDRLNYLRDGEYRGRFDPNPMHG